MPRVHEYKVRTHYGQTETFSHVSPLVVKRFLEQGVMEIQALLLPIENDHVPSNSFKRVS